MTTLDDVNYPGIYMLKFDEYFYIGKSVNIGQRLFQHMKDFEENCGAAKVQEAYDLYGPPSLNVLLACHKDNIDVMEAYFINLLYDPRFMLNTCMLNKPFEEDSIVDNILDTYCKMSFGEMSREIYATTELVQQYKFQQKHYDAYIEALEAKRSQEELDTEAGMRLVSTELNLNEYKRALALANQKASAYEEALKAYKQLPWYRKIFA